MKSGLVDMDISKYVRASDPRTRGSDRFYCERAPHPVLFNSFFPRTLREWNRLPPTTSSAPSLDTFKAHIGCCNTTSRQPMQLLH